MRKALELAGRDEQKTALPKKCGAEKKTVNSGTCANARGDKSRRL